MPIVRAQPQFCRGAAAREPLAVGAWHDPIPPTMHEKGWSGDVSRVEAPRADACEIVVDETLHAAGEGGTDHVDEPRPLAGEGGFVFGGEARLVVGVGQVLLQRGAPGGRRSQLGRAARAESFEPVEPLGAKRCHPGHYDRAKDAFRKQRGARQGVRATAGMAHDREPVDAQRVGDRSRVGGRRRHVPVRAGGRSPVAGPVVRHPADAEPGRGWEKGLGGRTDVRRAVVPENGEPAVRPVRARVVHVQCATVAQLEISLRNHPPILRGRVPW